jgi:hypothetical protein
MPIEASPEDVAEQRADAHPDPIPGSPLPVTDLPWDADPADVADQLAEVPLDDERY